jgi:glyoxylase-like metal-dependent hydrolase (beta-lactamase superfamily II)
MPDASTGLETKLGVSMRRQGLVPYLAAALLAAASFQSVQAADAAPAAKPAAPAAVSADAVIAAAAKAMGAENLNSIKMWGSGASYNLGQNNNANMAWPRTNLNDYVRAIDFTQPASKATAVTWAAPVTGGAAAKADYLQAITPASQAWAQQLEIWTTPWGFLKGAAQNHATAVTRTVFGKPYRIVTWSPPQKAPSGAAYKVIGYIGPTNLVERVDTWVENNVFGDLMVEAEYKDWRNLGGLWFPSTMVQSRAGHPVFDAQILGVAANPADIAKLVAYTPPPAPGIIPSARAALVASEKLADGVWRINGAYNAMAVEFKDYVVLFEPGPQSEARSKDIIAETKRLIPGKPIRYGVISHHHFDHTGGITAVVGEGITIVTPEVNKAFLMNALSAPRTLAPDAISKSGKKPVIEGFSGDKRVFTDGTRTFEIHVIKGLPHADGLVVGWLPKEKILVYADMFNLPPPANPVPDPPVVGTQVFLANLERLNIEPEKLLSIHSLNPDRLATMDDIRSSLGRTKR